MKKWIGIAAIAALTGLGAAGISYAAEVLGVPARELECMWVGTNHYYWFTRVVHRGRDLYPELKARMADRQPPPGRVLSAQLSRIYGYHIVYPQDDHIIEFYPLLTQFDSQDDLPYDLAQKARDHGYDASTPMPSAQPPSSAVREAFFGKYQAMLDDTALPAQQDNTVTGEGIGAMLSAIATGTRRVCIVNLPNQGAIPNLPATALVEIEAVTDSRGFRGIHMGEAPLVLKGMLEKRFVWQELVADAAVLGDRNLALQALLMDEMAILPDRAEAMLDELLAASKDLLPQFG